jgi:hypothetical protein
LAKTFGATQRTSFWNIYEEMADPALWVPQAINVRRAAEIAAKTISIQWRTTDMMGTDKSRKLRQTGRFESEIFLRSFARVLC